jgi:uncharacterized membrane protein YkoI
MRTTLIAAAALAAGAAGLAHAQTAAPTPIGVARAVSAAESTLGARAFEAELDRERGRLVYEVSLVKDGRAVQAEVDAATGEIVRRTTPKTLRLPLRGENLKAAQTAPRTLSQTIAAVETATHGKVTDIGLEQRGGRHYYEVELAGAQDRDILVDLRTGAITPQIDD